MHLEYMSYVPKIGLCVGGLPTVEIENVGSVKSMYITEEKVTQSSLSPMSHGPVSIHNRNLIYFIRKCKYTKYQF